MISGDIRDVYEHNALLKINPLLQKNRGQIFNLDIWLPDKILFYNKMARLLKIQYPGVFYLCDFIPDKELL